MSDRVLEESKGVDNEHIENMNNGQLAESFRESHDDTEETQEEVDNMPSSLETPVSIMQNNVAEKKKKKKKKKSKTAHLPEAGTVLADDYEEKYKQDPVDNPFDPERPISQRVEYAIWKYRKNHKFPASKKAIFDNYLQFGGIETGPNAFIGRETGGNIDDADGEQDFEAVKAETDIVRDEDHDEDVEVSFSEVVQIYLGNVFVSESRFITLQDYVDAPLLVDSFLRYLQIRNVCPEHAEDLEKARAIAALAKEELPMCKRVGILLPGTFNKSCSMLFEGEFKSAGSLDMSWATSPDVQNRFKAFSAAAVGLSDEEAIQHVSPVIGNIDQAKVVDSRWCILVKIALIEPAEKPKGLCRVTLADFDKHDDKFEILLEEDITNGLRTNMVMIATLYKLNCGQWYLDKTSLVSPSFYQKNDIEEEVVYEEER